MNHFNVENYVDLKFIRFDQTFYAKSIPINFTLPNSISSQYLQNSCNFVPPHHNPRSASLSSEKKLTPAPRVLTHTTPRNCLHLQNLLPRKLILGLK